MSSPADRSHSSRRGIYVEPSPAGGYRVMMAGHGAPVSHHDTEEEAHAHATAYLRGLVTEAADRPEPAE